jgi:hypothetical protein
MWLAQRKAAERRSSVDPRTIRHLPPQQYKQHSKGLDARELPLSAAEGKVFSLDIPFYRTRRRLVPTRFHSALKLLRRNILDMGGNPPVVALRVADSAAAIAVRLRGRLLH